MSYYLLLLLLLSLLKANKFSFDLLFVKIFLLLFELFELLEFMGLILFKIEGFVYFDVITA
jgi:hypothetical protein